MDDADLQMLKQRAPGLAAIYHSGQETILRAADVAALEQARVITLGRKSALTEFLRSISTLPAEDRPLVGKRLDHTVNYTHFTVKHGRCTIAWRGTSP